MNEPWTTTVKVYCGRCIHTDGGDQCHHPNNMRLNKFGVLRPIEKPEFLNQYNNCDMYEPSGFEEE